MGTAQLFRAFDPRITTSGSEWETAVKRLLDCAAALSGRYYGKAQASDHVTLIDSLAKQTSTTPIADVDAVYHMPGGTYSRFDSYAGNGQSALLQEVRQILTGHSEREDSCASRGGCDVRVRLAAWVRRMFAWLSVDHCPRALGSGMTSGGPTPAARPTVPRG